MSDAVVIALIVSIPPTIVGIAAVLVSLKGNKKVDDVHVLINSNLGKQIEASVKAALAEGAKIGTLNGIAQERARSAEDRERSAADRAEGRESSKP